MKRLAVLLLCFACSSRAFADLVVREDAAGGDYFAAPHCGVASVCAALTAVGTPVGFHDLLDTKYVGTPSGSSLEDLERAVRDAGAHSMSRHGMSLSALSALRSPAVLHVAATSKPRRYNHWIAYLGSERGMARILDAPHPVQLVSHADVLAQWDGVALIVSQQPVDSWRIQIGWLFDVVPPLLLASIGISIVGLARHWASGVVVRAAALLGMSLALGLGVDSLRSTGLLKNRVAVASIVSSQAILSVPEVSISDLRRIVVEGSACIIDARDTKSYGLGHVPGAVSVPINLPLSQRRMAFSAISRERPIVVYCQSSKCPYAHELARELWLNGYMKVSVCPPGWVELGKQ